MKIALIAALPVLLAVSACSEEAVDQATEEPLSDTQMPEEPVLTEPMPDGVVQDSDGNAVTDETLPDAGTDEMDASESTTDSAMESDADAEETTDSMAEDSDTADPTE
ncbi:hypothetical protein SAMN02745824_0584 [Parasphingorhabdus marina DSM 22363]|uniref:Uncharacterized protein n=1 Tax=Parasphingorhabdus marina DSM 22363 TaxID=1123272 RepID=A0A1N6CNG4_9SPHN|nr:hypothetical protein [Parasphingorhabdus marina]SIN60093.1 hypothetical protein SAMN02745824_0584 [Parasphingorhabdus marina DSM 22363]